MDNFKIKAEIFKLNTLGKLLNKDTKYDHFKRVSNTKNDEFGYFSALDNL